MNKYPPGTLITPIYPLVPVLRDDATNIDQISPGSVSLVIKCDTLPPRWARLGWVKVVKVLTQSGVTGWVFLESIMQC